VLAVLAYGHQSEHFSLTLVSSVFVLAMLWNVPVWLFS
jgi:hypothetical protein